MNVELSRAIEEETPAFEMTDKIVENVSSLMVVCGGIESISSTRYKSGFGDRLHVAISQFKEAPKEVRTQGIIIKDALAQILSVANVMKAVVKPTEEDMKDLSAVWEAATKDAKKHNLKANEAKVVEAPKANEVKEKKAAETDNKVTEETKEKKEIPLCISI